MLHDRNTPDKWIRMHEAVVNWNILRKDWKGLVAVSPGETASQIGALGTPHQSQNWNNDSNYHNANRGKGKGKDRGKGNGKKGKGNNNWNNGYAKGGGKKGGWQGGGKGKSKGNRSGKGPRGVDLHTGFG